MATSLDADNCAPLPVSGSALVLATIADPPWSAQHPRGLAGDTVFDRLRSAGVTPYDLAVFDEAHKLSAARERRRTRKSLRYQLAEALAGSTAPESRFAGLGWSARHLLLLTATPHMGKDSPYHLLWRLLDPHALGAEEAFRRFPAAARARHFIRRTKEEMVDLAGRPASLPTAHLRHVRLRPVDGPRRRADAVRPHHRLAAPVVRPGTRQPTGGPPRPERVVAERPVVDQPADDVEHLVGSRRVRGLGEPSADGTAPPLVDCVHALMHRWKTGEQSRVDAYLEERGLWRYELFACVVQALIELAEAGSDERATLESIQNHLRPRDGVPAMPRLPLA